MRLVTKRGRIEGRQRWGVGGGGRRGDKGVVKGMKWGWGEQEEEEEEG